MQVVGKLISSLPFIPNSINWCNDLHGENVAQKKSEKKLVSHIEMLIPHHRSLEKHFINKVLIKFPVTSMSFPTPATRPRY